MNSYVQINIDTKDDEESDILVARLSQAGFEGFEEEPFKLHAFIPETISLLWCISFYPMFCLDGQCSLPGTTEIGSQQKTYYVVKVKIS